MNETTKKLQNIAYVCSDGFIFVHLQQLVSEWELEARKGNKDAQRLLETVDIFDRLCTFAKEMSDK